jgi:hypothetical protein
VLAPEPIADVRLDSAGLGGAGRVLLSELAEVAEVTELVDATEKSDMVESRFGLLDEVGEGK